MTIYAFVEENEIKEIHYGLPTNWRNVSGFNMIGDDVDVLKSFGWYIVEDNPPSYDAAQYALDAPTFSFDGEKVTSSYTLSEIPKEDPILKQNEFMYQLRFSRDDRLYRSDWTMTADILKIKDDMWFNSWKEYRQQLRDFPNTFNFGPNDLPPDLNNIIWPIPPQ